MTHPAHLTDDILSALIDDQLSAEEASLAQAHLGTCSTCRARLAEMHGLVALLRSLESVDVPRDFRIGPRLVADPPNVIRLRRWYAWTRASAGALAAVFVFLTVGALYLDARPAATSATLAAKAQPSLALAPEPPNQAPAAAQGAPAAAPQNAPGAAAPPQNAAAAAADAAASSAESAPTASARAAAAAPAPAAGSAARAQAPAVPTSADTGEQIVATTSVRPLPTQAPTPTLLSRPQPAAAILPTAPQATATDPAAPLRIAAALVGVLAACGLFAALVVRRRLRAATPSHLE